MTYSPIPCGCTVDAELAAGNVCPSCGHRDHGRSGCTTTAYRAVTLTDDEFRNFIRRNPDYQGEPIVVRAKP